MVTSGLTALVVGRWRELALVGGSLAGLITLVSMVGWRSSDPTLLRPGTGTVENPCGPVGANLADLAYWCFGWGAWVLVPLVAVAILRILGRSVLGVVQWVAAGVLFGALMCMLDVAFRPGEPFAPGGLLGSLTMSLVESFLGTWGSVLAVFGVALGAVTVLGRIQWTVILGHVLEWLEGQWPTVRGWTDRGVDGAMAGLRWSARKLLELTGIGLGHGKSLAKRQARGAGATVRRMLSSLLRHDPEDDDTFASSWDSEIDVDAGYDSLPPVLLDENTAVGCPVALAEAEWEPTQASTAAVPSEAERVLGMFPEFQRRSEPMTGPIESEPQPHRAVSTAIPEHTFGGGEGSRIPETAEVPRPVRNEVAKPTPAPALAPAPSLATGRDIGPVVHENEFLEARVDDNGGALVRQASRKAYQLPKLSLLDIVPEQRASFDAEELRQMAVKLEEKLLSFKIDGQVTGVRPGPVVTIFEFLPAPGIKVSRIASLGDDLAMALRAVRVRIVAPIPGRGVVGIEIPSARRLTIFLREVLASEEFRECEAALPVVIGKDVEGRPVVADLAKMPHLLIGGTTGSGKSVGVNGMLMSLLYTKTPSELRMLLIDPKMLEFELYSGIPHLLHPVITQPKLAAQALAWACREMDERYAMLARWGTRNIVSYNAKVERESQDWTPRKAEKYGDPNAENPNALPEKLPYIVIVIDELADLMMVASKEIEESICRIAQKARACGIHLIVATQRPSVDVVTGLIKANLPTRIAFQLRSRHDSRTVLDEIGAENLLGRGDLLYMPPGLGNLQRVHGAFVSDDEVERVASHSSSQGSPVFIDTLEESAALDADFDEDRDELFEDAREIVVRAGKASTSMIQRHLKIGYNRAARIIDSLEAAGVIGPADGARPREILIVAGDLP